MVSTSQTYLFKRLSAIMIEFCCCKDSENMRQNKAQVKKVGQKPCGK
jgi:hypothetical protein